MNTTISSPILAWNYSNYHVLVLSHNILHGTILCGLEELKSLQVLDLSHDCSEAVIPSSIDGLDGFKVTNN